MKLLKTLAAIAALAIGSSASAITMTDTINPDVWLNGGNTSYTFNFDIGTVPTGMNVHGGKVKIWLNDKGVQNDPNGDGGGVNDKPESWEIDLGGIVGDTLGQGKKKIVIKLGNLTSVLASLNNNGKLDVTVTRTSGDFLVDKGRLKAKVPDTGATLSLLGLSLIGLVAVRKRFAA